MLLLIASGSAFLTFVAWLASGPVAPSETRSSDAVLVTKVFAGVTLVTLIAALGLTKRNGGGR